MKHSTFNRIGWILLDIVLVGLYISIIYLIKITHFEVNEDLILVLGLLAFGILIILYVSFNEILKSNQQLKQEKNETLNNWINYHKREIERLSKLIKK